MQITNLWICFTEPLHCEVIKQVLFYNLPGNKPHCSEEIYRHIHISSKFDWWKYVSPTEFKTVCMQVIYYNVKKLVLLILVYYVQNMTYVCPIHDIWVYISPIYDFRTCLDTTLRPFIHLKKHIMTWYMNISNSGQPKMYRSIKFNIINIPFIGNKYIILL